MIGKNERITRAHKETPRLKINARPWIIVGFLSIFLVFGLIGAWASTAPIASAVIALGNITVDGKRKIVQHLEGGIIKSINVRDGDVVEAGDILVQLESTQARSKLAIVQTALTKKLATEAMLIAERDEAEKITFPKELLARSEELDVQRLMASQRRLFQIRREALDGEEELFQQKIAQLNEQIVGLQFQLESKAEQEKLINEELATVEALLSRGQTTKPRELKLRRQSAALKGEKGELKAQIARLKENIGSTKLQIIQQKREFRKTVSEELNEVQSQIQDLRERAIAAKDVLARVDIKAPISGTVVNTEFHTQGAVAKPGEALLEIVPSGKKLVVDAAIQPEDIDNVSVGQSARVKITAFKQRTAPMLDGTVDYVSADSLKSQRTGQTYFTSHIRINESELDKLGELALKPGMEAEVMIRTGERTALQYLLQPIADSMDRAFREE